MTLVRWSGADRYRTVSAGRDTRHSFSFGPHYDPANLGFGPLVCLNDERLQPGAGYDSHAHRDLDLVTWVLSGRLLQADSTGGRDSLGPGSVQVHATGVGIRHAEHGGPDAAETRFLQSWLRPDVPGGAPARSVAVLDDGFPSGELRAVASGRVDAPLRLGAGGATLWVARLAGGESLRLPSEPLELVMAVDGEVAMDGLPAPLRDGDSVRIESEPGVELTARTPGWLLVWAFS